MIKAGDVSLVMVRSVAERLGPLRKKAVFLGGAATALLITDEATPEVRATKDVDIIVEVLSKSDYYQLEETLRSLGFTQSMEEDAPLCRWVINDTKVDVMPTDEKILGFTNKWYPIISTVLTKASMSLRSFSIDARVSFRTNAWASLAAESM